MKDKTLRKKIEKTRDKLASVTARLEKLEIKQAKRAARKTAVLDGSGLPAPVN